MSTTDSDHHKEKMVKRKELHDKKMAEKTADKGLLIVHTGTGKGKSSAALAWPCAASPTGLTLGLSSLSKGRGPPVSAMC